MTRGTRAAGERIDDPDANERGFNARNTLDSLKNFAQVLENVRGRRKALVLFSEGIDYDITDPFNNRDATTVMNATQRRDCRGDAGQRVVLRHRRARTRCRLRHRPSRSSRSRTIPRSA